MQCVAIIIVIIESKALWIDDALVGYLMNLT